MPEDQETRALRRLAAILAADVAGYSRLIGQDEEGTLAALRILRREIIDPGIAAHNGRLVKTTGDGLLVEFASVVDALRCAALVQREIAARNAAIAAERRIEFRVGIHQGDVVVEDGDILGDGVNIAARLEGMAEPGGICVSARVQEDAQGRLDLAFEDIGEQALKNIARPVRVFRVVAALTPTLSPQAGRGSRGAATAGEGQPPALALPDKPSIAVLPFQNMSGDPEQEYFVDGMVEEIITALSRIRWLFVIARNSSFTYKGQPTDLKRVGRELGVRYILEGSVRKAGNRVRITAQLIETETGAHLWADRFDGTLQDVFDLQDQVATSVAGVIEPTLQAAEIRRSAERPTEDLTAYDLYLHGIPGIFGSEQIAEALDFFEQAIIRDPTYGPALALAAVCCMRLCGEAIDPENNRRKAIEFARRALQTASNDAGVLANAAFALATFGEDLDAMTVLADRALALNPSFARGWHVSSFLRLWAGQLETAIEHAETSLRLSPRGQLAGPLYVIGMALLFGRRFDEAIGKLRVAIEVAPNFPAPHRALAACYAHLRRLDEARTMVARLRTMSAALVVRNPPFRNPEHCDLFLSGLRLAAGEE